ncbi:relaxase/mobilization nuclease domain-containing protein [Chryseobacterium taklimakanense]|uniref:Mobilization protein n=1 Tax=Chryseobacterium taklimakanense TaxID=536441 RepID=A0A3G8WK66_9FLAO|nr:relaxase/mobilization nuclease domain-containing protein [Chryseobacterium taklimakanense]AZI20608.1 mobilization protein [Chryseobacterium taklimakanense]
MIIKILGAASRDFHGVNYNDKKIEAGKGELMVMKNFPSFINSESSPSEVRDYLKSISQSDKVKKPQFHATISAKFQEYSKEQLTETAEMVLDELGYGRQPYIIVFHNDTYNNHIHMVSTRVDKKTGRKINDSFEKLRAQKALAKAQEQLFGISQDKNLEKLLNYRFSNLKQLETLLSRSGFKLSLNVDRKQIAILRNGVGLKSLQSEQINYSPVVNAERKRQLRAIISKYSQICSAKVFRVEDSRKFEGLFEKKYLQPDPKVEFESELQKKLLDMFGIDIVFHFKDDKKPFGCTLIDHKDGAVYKGSEIFRMQEIFDFTNETIGKRLFERLKDFNVRNQAEKEILIQAMNEKGFQVSDFMVFTNKARRNNENYRAFKNEVIEYLKTSRNDNIQILRENSGTFYAVHQQYHRIENLSVLIGEKNFEKIFGPKTPSEENWHQVKGLDKRTAQEFLNEMMKSSYTQKDPAEDELKRKRKKRK